MGAPDINDAAAAALTIDVSKAIEGYPLDVAIEVLSTLCSLAIADASPTADEAADLARRIGVAMGKDVRLNWPLVVARRKRG